MQQYIMLVATVAMGLLFAGAQTQRATSYSEFSNVKATHLCIVLNEWSQNLILLDLNGITYMVVQNQAATEVQGPNRLKYRRNGGNGGEMAGGTQ
ncbi:hypothetical protein BTUL_0008g01140 [Botrytis tulipae]|uniref:Uncharacterized protein n=1 Tax=Botrytis tulipae TaxID=87230 RepID=A0A4Z1F5I7_9HELO|nr:hypothetical protein BTUL_0008g01140 [Botrytis tulipae]